MIFANLGILAGVYLGKRLVDEYKAKRQAGRNDRISATPAKTELDTAESVHFTGVGGVTALAAAVTFGSSGPLSVLVVVALSYTTLPILERTRQGLVNDGKVDTHAYSSLITVMLLFSGSLLAASVNNVIYHFSEYTIRRSRRESEQLVADVYKQVPERVWVRNPDGEELSIPLQQMQAGDIVVVSTGEVIPIDGVIHEGEAMIDQQAMTGEAILAEKHPGDRVMTATIVLNGRIFIVSEHSGEYNSLNQLNELLQQTQSYKTGLQLKGEAWADKAAFPVVAVSAIMTPFIGPAHAFALLFSVPMNTVRSMLTMLTLTHMRKIHDDGILIKDGRVLEELIHIDTILFDKTGTLTQSLPQVSAVVSCGEFEPDTLLLFAAIAEQRLDHPIALAIVGKAVESGLEIRAADDSRYDLGLGVAVTIDGHKVHVGSQRFIEQQTAADSLSPVVEGLMTDAAGHSFVLIAVDHRIEGAIELNPGLRPEVPALIEALKQRGFRQLSIVSGDQLAPTRRLSEQLGMDQVYAAVRPHEKAEIVQQLQAEGRHVCFIGDGINDAIALKQANVSISLQSASTIAGEMAQVVMVRDTLESLDDLFATANGLHDRLGKSLKFWLGFGATNALAVPLLGFGPIQSSLYWAAAYSAGLFASSDRGLATAKLGVNRQSSGSPAKSSV